MTSTSGSCSRAWATRPPQNVPSPVTRTRLPISQPRTTTRLAVAQHVVERVLDRSRMSSASSMILLRE